MSTPLWIMDEVTTLPGKGRAFLDIFRTQYLPKAQERGMQLAHQMVEPAMWLDDEPNRIVLIWEVADRGAMWMSKFTARADPSITGWWDEIAADHILSRKRSVLASPEAIAEFTDV